MLAHKIVDASSVISMGASVREAALVDDHPNPESQREWYEAGNHVCHNEDKVVGEVTACGDNKAVVRFVRSETSKRVLTILGVPPEFYAGEEGVEVQMGIFEIKPDGEIPGVVGIYVDTFGVPVIFDMITDRGNHARVLRHAKYVMQSILLNTSKATGKFAEREEEDEDET